jgi:peptidyl-prolyl cis-trans isomerase SurA
MKKIILIILISLSGNTYSNVEILDRIAVIVDDGLIMESQVVNGLKDIIYRYEQQNIQLPSEKDLTDQVIESLIIEELQLQMARRAGVRISDEELNDSVFRIAQNNNLSLENFVDYIEENGESYESFRDDVRKQMIIQRIQRGRVQSEVNITEKEFDAFLATDESLNDLEPELLVKQILVADLEQANLIIERINQGEDFSSLAKEVSISANASSGGDLQWRRAIEMPELFANAINKKKIGFISDPLQSGTGYHILKLEDKRGPLVQYEDQWYSRHILLTPSAIRDDESTREELIEIRERVLLGENFSDLAQEFSEDPGSSKIGGDLDWLGKGVLAPEFEKVMTESNIGEISEVFSTQFGYHFLEVIDKRNFDLTRDNIENRAYQILFGRKFDIELENTLRTMRAEAFVEIKDLD